MYLIPFPFLEIRFSLYYAMMAAALMSTLLVGNFSRKLSIFFAFIVQSLIWISFIYGPSEFALQLLYAHTAIGAILRIALIIHFAEISEPTFRSPLIILGLTIFSIAYFVLHKSGLEYMSVWPTIFLVSSIFGTIIMYLVSFDCEKKSKIDQLKMLSLFFSSRTGTWVTDMAIFASATSWSEAVTDLVSWHWERQPRI